ncbi:PLP-dependent aminotransferase family protein [Pseudomonas sp. NPDC089569]|uniref:MocR-like pyridoxine biosynthesis transcription factor PdxR n=1 Tax=Pseudomonas sp. NPDC089569 TaxID=3390722 RepID=UPI003D069A77
MGQFAASPDASSRGAQHRIYARLRAQIEEGVLAAGAKLQSTRVLASELGVSRTTVTAAYEQLAAEGFVVTSSGKAAQVADLVTARGGQRKTESAANMDAPPALSLYGQRVAGISPYSMASPGARIDFRYGAVASRDFPALGWQRAYSAELVKRQPGNDQPEGQVRLRSALQGYLRRARGLVCDVEQILIVHGSQQGLDLCARLLLNPQDTFVFEDPGYRMARYCFAATGAMALPVPVDAGGLDTGALPEDERVRLAYVTPSHQFPMGAVLPVARRLQLLDWASRHRAWIIEDDYGGEFRYGQRPIDALQSMDTDARVIYVGTFSKALSPQLRLGYLVLPRPLIGVFRQAKRLTDRHAPRWEQDVLASLIESGTYERHVRRLRRENERRRNVLLASVEQHLAGQGQLVGLSAGLHGVLLLPGLGPQDEPVLQALALERGIGVYPLSPLYANPVAVAQERAAGLILGYAGLMTQQIEEGVRVLAEVIGQVRGDSNAQVRTENAASGQIAH